MGSIYYFSINCLFKANFNKSMAQYLDQNKQIEIVANRNNKANRCNTRLQKIGKIVIQNHWTKAKNERTKFAF